MMMIFELYLAVDLFAYLIPGIHFVTLEVTGNLLSDPPCTTYFLPANHPIVNLKRLF